MNKRIRKKKQVGEFAVKDLPISFTFLPTPLKQPELECFSDQFINFLEAHHLGIYGCFDPKGVSGSIIAHKITKVKPNGQEQYRFISVNDLKKEKVEAWLQTKSYLGDIKVG